MTIVIQPMVTEEQNQVAGLWHRSGLAEYSYLPTFQSLTLADAHEIFAEHIAPICRIWTAKIEQRLCGFLAMDGSTIDRLYIDPGYQGQGIGKQLLAFAMQRFPDGLRLYTHQQNARARNLYEAAGFKPVRYGISPPPESAPDVEYSWRNPGPSAQERQIER